MIAAERVRNPGTLDMLRRWWEAKYNLPSNHELFQKLTLQDLLVSFWEDYYLKNKIATHTTEGGQVIFTNTGDALIDKWERELALGLEPDLLDGVSPEEREREKRAMERLQRQKRLVKSVDEKNEGFSDDYTLQRSNLSILGQKGSY
jgi:hypothetical protein